MRQPVTSSDGRRGGAGCNYAACQKISSEYGTYNPRRSFNQEMAIRSGKPGLTGLLSVKALPNPQHSPCPLSSQPYRLPPFARPRLEKSIAIPTTARDFRSKGLAALKHTPGAQEQEERNSSSAFEVSLEVRSISKKFPFPSFPCLPHLSRARRVPRGNTLGSQYVEI